MGGQWLELLIFCSEPNHKPQYCGCSHTALSFHRARVSRRRQTMSATRAAFLQSGRRMRATVAPPTSVNRACDWRRNLIELRTLGPATLASATGHESRIETSDYDAMSGASSASDQGERGRLVR